MQPRTQQQIYADLGQVYEPQVQSVMAQQALLPQAQQADEQSLQGQQTRAFDDILGGARRRGTGVAFGGIPLGEQAQYTATTYMPELARLKGTYAQKGQGLTDAILAIQERRNSQANDTFTNERNFFEQQRQFNEQQALQREQMAAQERQAAASRAAAASFAPSLGAGGGPTLAGKAAASGPKFIGNNDLRGHLNYLAQKEGNQDAAIALRYVGNDGKYSLSPYVTNPSIIAALNRMGATNVYKVPAGQAPSNGKNQYGGSTNGLKF